MAEEQHGTECPLAFDGDRVRRTHAGWEAAEIGRSAELVHREDQKGRLTFN